MRNYIAGIALVAALAACNRDGANTGLPEAAIATARSSPADAGVDGARNAVYTLMNQTSGNRALEAAVTRVGLDHAVALFAKRLGEKPAQIAIVFHEKNLHALTYAPANPRSNDGAVRRS